LFYLFSIINSNSIQSIVDVEAVSADSGVNNHIFAPSTHNNIGADDPRERVHQGERAAAAHSRVVV